MTAAALDVLTEISDAAADLLLAQAPLLATRLGYREHDERVPDVSAAGEAALLAGYSSLLRRTELIDPEHLGAADRITRSVLLARLGEEVASLECRPAEMDVGVNFAGAQTVVLHGTPRLPVPDAEAAESYLRRCHNYVQMLDDAGHRLQAGVTNGRFPVARAVRAAIAEIDGCLATDLQQDPHVIRELPAGWAGAEAWRGRMADLLRDELRPALRRYRQVLAEQVLPVARPEDRSGLCWLAEGPELYATAVRRHTTTDLAPHQVHELGLSLLGEIEERVAALCPSVLGVARPREAFQRLRDDPALRFGSREEMVALAEAAMQRSQDAARSWFGRRPRTDCVVREVPPHEAAVAIAAWYQEPSMDGSRPGTYWLNTGDPASRARFDAEAIAFHEAVPGHHLQIGLALEAGELPLYRRLSIFTAYAEGWGLYAEQLADEGGLYSDDLQRLGYLTTAAMRACRLVADTGLHALGWSRQRAVDLFLEHTAWGAEQVEREVDRYISWPGQALGYQVGCTEILRLRDRARASLGPRFSLSAFHDVVLEHGSVPLSTLDELVAAYETTG